MLNVLEHPLIQSKLTLMRDINTGNETFRRLLEELTAFMVYEITRKYPLRDRAINTPLEPMTGRVLEASIVLVPILRAGTGMLGGVLHLVPMAKVGHIGLFRDPTTLDPVEYFCKLPPELPDAHVILVDPMLATGGSAISATDIIKREGGRDIQFVCLVAAPEGIEAYASAHPDVPIYTAAIDRQLNEKGYILPGLGDAGDRIFGT